MDQFDGQLIDVLRRENAEIAEAVRQFIEGRGKRLRPMLVFLSSGACGARDDAERIRYGIITELIHTASLFHDDVLDDASYRRGIASSNLVLGNYLSVLAGDYLYAKALALVDADRRDIQKVVNQTVLSMTKGEISQALHRFRFDGGLDHYNWIIERKTADLISMSCYLGAVTSGTEDQIRRMTEFGRNLGIIFQIIDDLLDWTADETKLGKKTFQDAREGLITLPVFKLLEKLPDHESAEIIAALSDSKATHADSLYLEIRNMMFSTGVVDEIRELAHTLSDQAIATLDSFPPTPELDDLHRLIPLLFNRNY